MTKVTKNIVIENARIGFRNFAGEEARFNPEGSRNFVVFIEEDELAQKLENDGWNIKYLPETDEFDEQAYLQVAVSYNVIPPKIVMITSGGKTLLNEETVEMLDWAEIENVDIIIRPYNWEVNGRTGVKAYVKSMYVTIVEDEFEQKYADVPTN